MTRAKQSSKADKLGFAVFTLLALTAVVLFLSRQNNDPTVSSQPLTTIIPQAAAPEPTPLPTTLPVAMPAAPASLAVQAAPAVLDISEKANDAVGSAARDDTPANATNDLDTIDDPPASDQEAESEAKVEPVADSVDTSTVNTEVAAESSAQPATAVPNPQPSEPTATAVPNPQPAATATAVPNPQPASLSADAIPADAPAGGTFTHTLTATVARPILHTSPGGPVFTPTFNGTALPAVNPTVFGNALVYRVLAGAPGDAWAKVYVPARPNGTTAWVQTSQFNWGSSNRMLQINVANNTVTVFEGANTLLTTSAVTGKTSSPTPLASGWVEEIMAGPSAAYGTKLISLGMFSDVLNSFGGGVPKIALHGTNNPGLMGQYASNGCIRVRNEIINQIATMLPVGSKVVIVG